MTKRSFKSWIVSLQSRGQLLIFKKTESWELKYCKDKIIQALHKESKQNILLDESDLTECRKTYWPCVVSNDLRASENKAADTLFPYRRVICVILYIATHFRADKSLVAILLVTHVEHTSMKPEQAGIKGVKYFKSISRHGKVLKPPSLKSWQFTKVGAGLWNQEWEGRVEAVQPFISDQLWYIKEADWRGVLFYVALKLNILRSWNRLKLRFGWDELSKGLILLAKTNNDNARQSWQNMLGIRTSCWRSHSKKDRRALSSLSSWKD